MRDLPRDRLSVENFLGLATFSPIYIHFYVDLVMSGACRKVSMAR